MNTRLIGFFIFLAVLVAMVVAANGAALPGTIVAAEIVPGGDDANTFSIGNTTWMKGTMKQVPDIATRDLITADRRSEGMFCYVTGETNLYALVGGTNNANWTLWASPTNQGVTLVTVNNFVETNVFSSFTATNIYATNIYASNIVTIYLVSSNAYFTNVWIQTLTSITNFFDTVYVTNKLDLLYLNPNQFVATDANDNLVSILNGNSLTNISPTNIDLVAGSGVTFTTNNHRVTVTATGSGGTVTSVGITGPAGVSWANTPVTGAGVLTGTTPGLLLTNGESVATSLSNSVTINAGGSSNWVSALVVSNLTANTVVKSDANDYLVSLANGGNNTVLHGTTPPAYSSVANADLANSSVTVNGTANHVTTTSASIALGGSATLDVGTSVVLRDANNVWVNTSSNFNNNAVWTDATNANNTTPDFAIRTSTLSTNASFTWLLPTHLDGSGKVEQWIKTSVTNSSGTLITMTAPGGCHVCGAGANNVTNWTEILWQYYPPSGPTNYWPIPGY